jgi:adenylate cyclase
VTAERSHATPDAAVGGDSIAALDETLLGGPRRHTEAEVVRAAGTDLPTARALWRAMGFPSTKAGDATFTDADIEALRTVSAVRELAVGSEADVLTMTRVMGQALSRLAHAEVETIAEAVQHRMGVDQLSFGEAIGASLTRSVELLPALDRLVLYVWHRQLAAATGRALAAPVAGETPERTVGFADLVGFTERVRELDETKLAELVDRFDTVTSEVVTEFGGHVVKTVGDEVFFDADDVGDGAEIALRLAEQHAADLELPDVRVGLACGAVLARYGDIFGPVVNVAARLTALARPGTVLADRAVARTLETDAAYTVKRLRPARVRGYRHLEASVLRRA